MKMFRRISALVLCLVLLSATCIVASAASAIKTDEKGSITIYTYESKKDNVDGSLDLGVTGNATGEEMTVPTGYKALAGVVYQLCDADGTAISGNTATTDESGVATFADLAQDTYIVKATSIPANVTSTIEPMTVTIPMTNPAGDGFIYDVKVYPKVDSVYGKVTMIKYDEDGATPLSGAEFTLYDSEDNEIDTYTTNAEGKITITGLVKGEYTLVETKAPNGYILDSKVHTIVVPTANKWVEDTGEYVYEFSMTNGGDLNIEKEVVTSNAAVGGDVTWKITPDVPYDIETYQSYVITDTLDEALAYKSLTIDGLTVDTDYEISVVGQKVTVTLTTAGMQALKGESSVEITLTTTLNADGDLLNGVQNTATLDYKNSTGTEGTASDTTITGATTSGFQVKKVDGDDAALAGATIKLYSDAACTQEVTFYTDKDLTTKDTSVVTGDTGIVGFYGIANGTYYVLETKAPTGYELDGNVYTVIVDDDTDTDFAVEATITNIKSSTIINLPQTGGIGVEIVVIAGVLMMIAAAFVIRRKRVNG